MVKTFVDLAEDGLVEEDNEKVMVDWQNDKDARDKVFLEVYNTPAGKKMFDVLWEFNVDIIMAYSEEEMPVVMERQGRANLVRGMFASAQAIAPEKS